MLLIERLYPWCQNIGGRRCGIMYWSGLNMVRILFKMILVTHTHTHEEHELVPLVLMHSVKLCMDETLEEGDKYFI